jgi:hypothetical protein
VTRLALVIQGRSYDLDGVFTDEPTMAMVKRAVKATGIGWNDIVRGVLRMANLSADEVLRDPELLDAFTAMVWVARTMAGETFRDVDEANDFTWSEWSFESTPTEGEEDEPDPTPAAPVPSDPVAATPPPADSPKATRSATTRKKRS